MIPIAGKHKGSPYTCLDCRKEFLSRVKAKYCPDCRVDRMEGKKGAPIDD